MTDLITVPTFTFPQGDPFGDSDAEYPIQVLYYNGPICLKQGDNEICIRPADLRKLVKEIAKHLPEALDKLKS